MKNMRIVWSTAATYGMNSRCFLRFWKTHSDENADRSSAQKRSEPRCPAQRPVIL